MQKQARDCSAAGSGLKCSSALHVATPLTMLWVGAVCRGCERRGDLSRQLDLMLDGAILAAGATDVVRCHAFILQTPRSCPCA